MDIDHLSYSSVNSYMMCPRGWRLRYIDKIKTQKSPALIVGSAIHNTVEDLLSAKVGDGYQIQHDDYLAKFRQHFSQHEGDLNVNWGGSSFSEQMEIVERIFSNQEITNELSQLVPINHPEMGIGIEWKVELDVPGVPVPIIGYIDIVDSDGIPGDFKTSSKKWSQSRADNELQASVYLAALSQKFQAPIEDGLFKYHVLTKTKSPVYQEITTTRTPGQLFFMYDLIKSIWDAIAAGAFPMNTSTWKCSPKWCEYWGRCRGKYD